MLKRARRPETHEVCTRTCVACRLKQPINSLVRHGTSADGGVQTANVGGRGAWICQSGDEAHDALIADGLRRGLKGRITAEGLKRILIDRKAMMAKGGSR